ncbi:MAG: hypothetical protein WAT19_00875 [Ferruginibacter sp.]
MKQLLIIIFLFCFIACNTVENQNEIKMRPEDSNPVQILLIDSLGMIEFSLPLRYDTSFSWVHYSDCGKACNEQKYRFQSKQLPLIKESGWIWEVPKDSIDRFTISHTLDFPFHDGDTTKSVIRHNHLKEELLSDQTIPPIIFDTIQRINDRYYSIFVMEKSNTIQSKKVLAVTTIKSNLVKFQYELMARENDTIAKSFIEKSIDLIKTIRIGKGV